MSDEISSLIDALSAEDVTERVGAAEQLCYLGEEARPAAVPLARACGDADEGVREWAVGALEEMGPPDAADTAALAELLLVGDGDTAYWAATLIGRLAADGADAVPQLTDAVDHSDLMAVRQRAAWALGKIGAAAQPALETLQKAAKGDDERLARLASEAISQISDG